MPKSLTRLEHWVILLKIDFRSQQLICLIGIQFKNSVYASQCSAMEVGIPARWKGVS